jgi:hypothetical protein
MARTLEEAEKIISYYEQDGSTRLYYALNRKQNEMADMLNKSNLSTLDLTDAKDKTFERLKVIWNDAASISVAVKSLGDAAGITGDEDKDIATKRQRTSPESIANALGNTAGQQD